MDLLGQAPCGPDILAIDEDDPVRTIKVLTYKKNLLTEVSLKVIRFYISPTLVIKSSLGEPCQGGVPVVERVAYEAVFDRVIMDIVYMALQICRTADDMIPVAMLPQAALAHMMSSPIECGEILFHAMDDYIGLSIPRLQNSMPVLGLNYPRQYSVFQDHAGSPDSGQQQIRAVEENGLPVVCNAGDEICPARFEETTQFRHR
ncbi:MAG TPA: hypothetical protein PKW75_01905 [candidate division Zixibacteria bacterium]|nr:hypothetical protein [candidate division Zixibacteria bacterium]MDM7974338.1 hypothetical protein [candidate division Zixibacteria bacterium]HOD66350.1 hypothetical protein [candidate division Zixibacteria bacterium]HOZ07017.1 hypothetical protein [candidate division Zixibacteria bacterium]HPC10970.1 hypothetical protein [candidate division Zixibacteria bacterium]